MNRESILLSGSDIVQHHRRSTKELPEIGSKLYEPSGSWFEENKLDSAIDERYSLLKEARIEKDSILSTAKWDPVEKKVVVLRKKGKEWETYGHHNSKDNLDYLNPEEALFLIESNSLILINGNVEVSLEIAYALLLNSDGCSLEQYRVFSHLSRLGYKLIRHKVPKENQSTLNKATPQSHRGSDKVVEKVKETGHRVSRVESVDIVLIDDTSSESSNDDVVILDVITDRKNKEVIDILDDDSRDSDLVLLETPGLVELPLLEWSYVHRNTFLSSQNDDDQPVFLDPYIVSTPDYDILNEIPNVKGHKIWLYRPPDLLLPDGIWPFHFKYRIDLNVEKNEGYRGRGGFRGRPRGRGWYLQRQVSQMKNYTLSLMNMVSQLMGGQGMEVIPPPPALFQGPNYRYQRGYNFQRQRNPTWGRVSYNYPQRDSYHYNQGNVTRETVELSDDEANSAKRSIKTENEDVKPKRIKLEADAISIGSGSSTKIEPLDIKEEVDVKTEPTKNLGDTNVSSLSCIGVKTEIKAEIKTESEKVNEVESMEDKDDAPSKNCQHQNIILDDTVSSTTSLKNNQSLDKPTKHSYSESIDTVSVTSSPGNQIRDIGACSKTGLYDGNASDQEGNSQSNKPNNSEDKSLPDNSDRVGNKEITNKPSHNIKQSDHSKNLNENKPARELNVQEDNSSDIDLEQNNLDTRNSCKEPLQGNKAKDRDNIDTVIIDDSSGHSVEGKPTNTLTNVNNQSVSDTSSVSVPLEEPTNNEGTSKLIDKLVNKDLSCTRINIVENSPSSNTNPKHISEEISGLSETIVIPEDSMEVSESVVIPEETTKASESIIPKITTEVSKSIVIPEDTMEVSESITKVTTEVLESIVIPEETTKVSESIVIPEDTMEVSESIPKVTTEVSESIVIPEDTMEVSESIPKVTTKVSESIVIPEDTMEVSDSIIPEVATKVSKIIIIPEESTEISKIINIPDETTKSSESIVIPDDTMEVSEIIIPKITTEVSGNISTEHSCEEKNDSTLSDSLKNTQNDSNVKHSSDATEKTSSWKEFKGSDKPIISNTRNVVTEGQNEISLSTSDEEEEEPVDFGTPLIQAKHCSSIDGVLKRLQIFGEYKTKTDKKIYEKINVAYDVYLPNSSYYRNLPPDPDYRLIILRLEDSFPDAEQMINLRRIYENKTNFLFAVVLKESIAYYLYDNVCLPVDNEVV